MLILFFMNFSHPVINGIRVKNKNYLIIFMMHWFLLPKENKLGIMFLQNYPELKSNEDMLKSEILTYGLQVAAANKLTDKNTNRRVWSCN